MGSTLAATSTAPKPSYSEPEWSKTFRKSHDAPYWIEDIDDKITPEIRKILLEYSHIPEQDLKKHVYDTREALWSIRSYPCTGLGVYLTSELTLCPAYTEILTRVQSGGKFLDIGAFMGYDLRRLVFDGCAQENLFAVDIVSHWDVGYAFFNDRGRFTVPLLEADVLAPNEEVRALKGTMDVVNISHVVHQWPRRTQKECVRRVLELTRRGGLVVGFQAGNVRPRPLESHAGVRIERVEERPEVHDAASWRGLWKEVGAEIGVELEVEARLMTWAEAGRKEEEYVYMGDEMRLLEFVVRRLDG